MGLRFPSYPANYHTSAKLRNRQHILFRIICLDDEEKMVEFHRKLSPLTVRRRYFDSMSFSARTDHKRLMRICNPDLTRECAVVAVVDEQIIAVGRLEDQSETAQAAEFAAIVVDDWQRKGVGRLLMNELLKLAAIHGIKKIYAELMPANRGMRKLLVRMGFEITDDFRQQTTYVVKHLDVHRQAPT